ncbi:hypothetical protein DNTS_031791 [Danionella cerebrum]|uniref:Tubulin epsilon and delta complex protein 2 n=1 Tax=Danionella cerebrum TaxID=2873325 RepID=A0A553RF91_9TELE|nr:hypothetical protein DNTS_031791 [Danionella translucida]
MATLSMSLVQALEKAARMCKAEEVKLTENIRQYKEILCLMRTRVTECSDLETQSANETEDGIPPEEKQEIELLEQALKKAAQIRSVSEAQKEPFQRKSSNESKGKASASQTVKVDKEKRAFPKKPDLRRGMRGNLKHGTTWMRPVLAQKPQTAPLGFRGRASAPKSSSGKVSTTGSDKKSSLQDRNPKELSLDNAEEGSTSDRDEKSTAEQQKLIERWIPSPLFPVWQAKRSKQNRLWMKVLRQQSKPVPERARFTERLRAAVSFCSICFCTFPSEWPSRSPADLSRELEVLSLRCLNLTHCFQSEHQALKDALSGCSGERCYESLQMLEGLEKMTEELLTCVGLRRKDWERWEKWSSGSLCPIKRRQDWADPDAQPCLPPILSYSNEAELRHVQTARVNVERLEQALQLQQVMSDNLASCWDSQATADRPSPMVLRSVWSLLAEGGVQFPSLVLDSE